MRQDIAQALATFQVKTFGNKNQLKAMEQRLAPDEVVYYIAPTNAIITTNTTRAQQKTPGIIAVTNKRIVFNYKIAFQEGVDSVSLSEVSSINCTGNGLSGGHVEVHTIAKSYDFLVSYNKQTIARIQSTLEWVVSNFKSSIRYQDQPQPHPVASDNDAISQIQRLSQLKDQGIISVQEFEAKKAELLAKL